MYKFEVLNGTDRDWTKHSYVLAFGICMPRNVLVYANSLEDALDTAVDWLKENHPGLIVNDQVNEVIKELLASGKPEDSVYDHLDGFTSGGNCGDFIDSDEWSIVFEDPSREQLKEYIAMVNSKL